MTRARLNTLRDKGFVVASMLPPLWLVGQSARDSSWLTGLCFYIPSVVLVITFLGFGLIYAMGNQLRNSLLAIALALGFIGFVENRFFRPLPPTAPDALRLVHWNTGGALHRNGVQCVLLAQHADLYVLSEIGASQSVRKFTDALGPAYQASVFGGMAVVGKGIVRPGGWIFRRNRQHAGSVGRLGVRRAFGDLVRRPISLPTSSCRALRSLKRSWLSSHVTGPTSWSATSTPPAVRAL